MGGCPPRVPPGVHFFLSFFLSRRSDHAVTPGAHRLDEAVSDDKLEQLEGDEERLGRAVARAPGVSRARVGRASAARHEPASGPLRSVVPISHAHCRGI